MAASAAAPVDGPRAGSAARRVAARRTPAPVLAARMALAAQVAAERRAAEAVEAAIVVGSTALARCSEGADLDLVLVTPEPPAERFTSLPAGGVQVEIERVSRAEALAATAGGGWVWELREGARLGCGRPVVDPGGLGARLAARARAMVPDAGRYEATLRGVYLAVVGAGRGPARRSLARRADALRGCFDNLALLALLERPRRYQKAKWVPADLVHAREWRLAEALLAAYGAAHDRAGASAEAVAGAAEVVGRVLATAGLPPVGTLLAMGHAPDQAEASYVARCLADAGDLRTGGRHLEAQYVARFSARLAAGLLDPGGTAPGLVEAMAGADPALAARYLALFPDPCPADLDALLAVAVAAADDRRRWLDAHSCRAAEAVG